MPITEETFYNSTALSFAKDDWRTPKKFARMVERKLDVDFVLDIAASNLNSLCTMFYSKESDAFTQMWAEDINRYSRPGLSPAGWLNPPYGRDIRRWTQKAIQESSESDVTIVLLVPARTDTLWFRELVRNEAQIYFITGRISFEDDIGTKNPAPFPSAVVALNKGEPLIEWWDVEDDLHRPRSSKPQILSGL